MPERYWGCGQVCRLRDLIYLGGILEGFLEMVGLEQGNKIRAGPCPRQRTQRDGEGVSCRGNEVEPKERLCGVVSANHRTFTFDWHKRHVEKIGRNV